MLHVGAMPYPTPQGTQAAVTMMWRASRSQDARTSLLVYGARGPGVPDEPGLIRGTWPGRFAGARSGPSIGKVVLDVGMVGAIRRLARELGPPVIVAHHIEAAWAAIVADIAPVIFVAHTDLPAELPSYTPRLAGRLAQRAGTALEGWLLRRANMNAAISPWLRERLAGRYGLPIGYLPIPWEVPPRSTPEERVEMRKRLGLATEGSPPHVILYAGNLDAYQGWQTALHGFALYNRQFGGSVFLLATNSDPGPAVRLADALGVIEHLRVQNLESEGGRRAFYAAADVAIVPRAVPGGLPVKLLDALARAVPCIATEHALAGLPLGRVVHTCDLRAVAVADALRELCGQPSLRHQLAAQGPAYVRAHHNARAYLDACSGLANRARSTRGPIASTRERAL